MDSNQSEKNLEAIQEQAEKKPEAIEASQEQESQDLEAAEAKPDFGQKLADIRAASDFRKEQIDSLLELEIERSNLRYEPPEQLSLEEAESRFFDDLDKNSDSLATSEYLNRIEQLQKSVSLLKLTKLKHKQTIDFQIADTEENIIGKLDSDLEAQSQKKGLGKIPAFFKKLSLQGEKTRAQEEKNSLLEEAKRNQDQYEQILVLDYAVRKREEQVRQKHNDNLREEIAPKVQGIEKDYAKFAEEILRDGRITQEIQDSYIQDVTEQFIETEEMDVSQEDKQEIYAAVKSCIVHRDDAYDEKLLYLQKLDDVLVKTTGTTWLREYGYRPILEGLDRGLQQGLVAKIAASDIDRIKRAIEKNGNLVDLEIEYAPGESDFDERVRAQLYGIQHTGLPSRGTISIWNALKNSPTAAELFGDEIEARDQKYYEAIIRESIRNSPDSKEAIETLYYYPTPDAVRNLVLTYAGTSHKAENAKHTLSYLSQRKDWKDILENAADTYPSLRPLVPILEAKNSDQPFFDRQPEIRKRAGDLSLEIFYDESADEQLKSTAFEALPNEAILDVLEKRDLITSSQSEIIREAESILDNLPDSSHLPPVSSFYFRNAVRDDIKFLLRIGEEASPGQIEPWADLSQRIKENSSDYNALSFLTSAEIVQKLKNQTLDIYEIPIFLDAYKHCPELVPVNYWNVKLLRKFCEDFSGQETVEFFKNVTDAYKDRGEPALEVLYLAEDKSIDKELILALPQEAPALLDERMKETRVFVLTHFAAFIKDSSDLKFLNKVVTVLGENSDIFLRAYEKSLSGGKITTFDKEREFKTLGQFFNDLSSAENIDQPVPAEEAEKTDEENRLESGLGIESREDRLIETSLFVDKKFLDTAIITGNTQNPELMFGRNEWMDYLEARKTAKEHGDQALSVDFIMDLHRSLTTRSNPDFSGKIREVEARAADYGHPHRAVTYTDKELEAVRSNPLLSFKRKTTKENTGFIMYSKPEEVMDKLNELCDWYNSARNKEEYNPFQIAAELQQKFVSIHPYENANGALSRVLMNWSLENDGQAPAMLENPNDDILSPEEEWVNQVEGGSKKYAAIKERQEAMERAGVEDPPMLFGLGKEEAFYEHILKHIKESPRPVSNGKGLEHSDYEEFHESLVGGMKVFKGLLNPESEIQTRQGFSTLSQGGLITSGFIKSAGVKSPALENDFYHSNTEIYRGGVCRDTLTDERILSMFQNYTGIETGYRALKKSGVNPTSARSVDPEKIQEAMDYYNKMTSSFFFKSLRANDKNPYASDPDVKDLERTIEDHTIGDYKDIWNSPFASSSLNIEQSRSWARATSEKFKNGVLVKARAPREGAILTFGQDMSYLSKAFLHPVEEEMLVTGGLHPDSIDEIEVYVGENSVVPKIIARREKHEGVSVVEIEEKQGVETVKRSYKFNPQTNSFEAVRI